MSRATNVKLPYGFKQTLGAELGINDTVLTFKDADAHNTLCTILGRDCYTHLILSDCVLHEIVRVECVNDMLLMTRAQECTERMKFAACSPVFFEMTPELCKAVVVEDADDGTVQGFKSDSLDISQDPDDATKICIELKSKDAVEFCTPGYKFTFENGCLEKEDDVTTAIKDGVVRNPTICFKDNKIVDVEAGDVFDYTMTCNSCGGCGCTECTTTTDTP